jgi:pimeloyl-ACP methyl ester carboxylesterase
MYAPVGDLSIYYEIHGQGELQGHGRTADADGPITCEQMADDTAALIRHLELEDADVVGYSMGGGVALQLAIRHPSLVRRLVVASAGYRYDAMPAEAIEMFPSITPEMFAGSPFEQAYLELAPNPADFPKLVEKLKTLDTTPFAWPDEDVRQIAAPTLIVLGDSDIISLEHAVGFFRLRGGGVVGDMAGLPESQLAVLPGTTHFIPPGSALLDRADWLLAMIPSFLDA